MSATNIVRHEKLWVPRYSHVPIVQKGDRGVPWRYGCVDRDNVIRIDLGHVTSCLSVSALLHKGNDTVPFSFALCLETQCISGMHMFPPSYYHRTSAAYIAETAFNTRALAKTENKGSLTAESPLKLPIFGALLNVHTSLPCKRREY